MIRGIQEHLFAVLRDVVYVGNEINGNPKFDLRTSAGVTDAVFHILRNANVLQPITQPNVVVCWGGHSINRRNTNTPSWWATSSACAAWTSVPAAGRVP
jgi:hypothetical protein